MAGNEKSAARKDRNFRSLRSGGLGRGAFQTCRRRWALTVHCGALCEGFDSSEYHGTVLWRMVCIAVGKLRAGITAVFESARDQAMILR